jgi:hypothetical protein
MTTKSPYQCGSGFTTPEIYRDYPRPPIVLRKEFFGTLHFMGGGGGGESVLLYSLAIVMSCVDPSVRIVTKSPKLGPLLIFSISDNTGKNIIIWPTILLVQVWGLLRAANPPQVHDWRHVAQGGHERSHARELPGNVPVIHRTPTYRYVQYPVPVWITKVPVP